MSTLVKPLNDANNFESFGVETEIALRDLDGNSYWKHQSSFLTEKKISTELYSGEFLASLEPVIPWNQL